MVRQGIGNIDIGAAVAARPVQRPDLLGRHGPGPSCRVTSAFSAFFPRSPAVASNTSKTARASVRAGQSTGGALSVLGEYKYLIPLANGRFAYVRNLMNGKTEHLRTDSDKFVEEIRVLATAGHGAKIHSEINVL